MVTPLSKKLLYEANWLKSREFDYNVSEFMNPYEDLMTHSQPMHQHLPTLNFIVREFNCKTVLELGTKEGYSTIAFLYACKDINGHLYSCDIDPCPIAKKRVKERKLEKYWTFMQEDSKKLNFSRPIDLLLVDSEHSYDQVKAEIERFAPKVKKGGFIVFHDVIAYRFQGRGEEVLGVNKGLCDAIEFYIKKTKNPYWRWFNDCGLGIVRKR